MLMLEVEAIALVKSSDSFMWSPLVIPAVIT